MYRKRLIGAVFALLCSCGGEHTDSTATPPSSETHVSDAIKIALSHQYGALYEGDAEGPPTLAEDAPLNSPDTAQSRLNVQVSGVDEASLIKYDGDILLSAYGARLNHESNTVEPPKVYQFSRDTLLGTSGDEPSQHFQPADSDIDGSTSIRGLLRSDTHAALISATSYYFIDFATTLAEIACYIECLNGEPQILIDVWQYRNDAGLIEPEPLRLGVDGHYLDSRAIGNTLYLFSRFEPRIPELISYPLNEQNREANQALIDGLEADALLPHFSVDGTPHQMLASEYCDLSLQREEDAFTAPSLLLVTAIPLNDPQNWKTRCVFGYADTVFVSQQSAYLVSSNWRANESDIIKFSLDETGATYEARGSIAGFVAPNSYHLGEQDNHLIVVHSDYSADWNNAEHQLSILRQEGQQLTTRTQLPNERYPEPIGKPGEQLYGIRLLDQRAYIVTFDKVDPLYVIDLSDLDEPQQLGQLEIPGFSSYLHPLPNHYLLGVGMNARNEGAVTYYQGLNIRLFDIRDPAQPSLVNEAHYGLRGSHSAVFSSPHAFTGLYDATTQHYRFALPMRLHGDAADADPLAPASMLYAYTEHGLYQFEIDLSEAVPQITEHARYLPQHTDTGYNSRGANDRSVIDGDHVFYRHDGGIDVLSWGSGDSERHFPHPAP